MCHHYVKGNGKHLFFLNVKNKQYETLLLTAFVKNVCVEEILNYSFFWIEMILTNLAILPTSCYKYIWNVIAFVQMHYNLFIH